MLREGESSDLVGELWELAPKYEGLYELMQAWKRAKSPVDKQDAIFDIETLLSDLSADTAYRLDLPSAEIVRRLIKELVYTSTEAAVHAGIRLLDKTIPPEKKVRPKKRRKSRILTGRDMLAHACKNYLVKEGKWSPALDKEVKKFLKK